MPVTICSSHLGRRRSHAPGRMRLRATGRWRRQRGESVRYPLILNIRRQIQSGTYETPKKLEVCAQRLMRTLALMPVGAS
jgi:hypothetical protein